MCPLPDCVRTFKQAGSLAQHLKSAHRKVYQAIPGRNSRRRHGKRRFLDYITALTLQKWEERDFPDNPKQANGKLILSSNRSL